MDVKQLGAAIARSLRDHWIVYLVEGAVLLVLGVLVVVIAPVAPLATTIFLGWILLAGGIIALAAMLWTRRTRRFWWSLMPALLGIGAGLILLA
jgi:uncharacterized membrane protein HdeD (DUF308 family)